MKIYRIAQSTDQKSKFVQSVFNILERQLGVPVQHSRDGYLLDKSIERHNSTDIRGESWLQVSHSRFQDGFYVERYFENERMQNEYGATRQVATDYVDVDKCIHDIRLAIESLR